MKDSAKTKKQLIAELETLRRRVQDLEQRETDLSLVVEPLKATGEIYRSLVETTDDSIYLVDDHYRYLFMNTKHRVRMGLSDTEYIGRGYGDFHSPEETELFVQRVNEVFEKGLPIQAEYKSGRDGGSFLQTLSPVRGPEESLIAVSVISKNITDLKLMEEKLLSLSLTDELTGLYNRRGFFLLADQQVRLSNRMKTGICLLYADLDGLKDINDTHGHEVGDAALIETATVLRKNYRESDIIARIGGDEFVVIPVGTSRDHIQTITDRFYTLLAAHNAQESRRYSLSISIGVAFYDPAAPRSINELLNEADALMYEDKRLKKLRGGRDRSAT